MTERPGVVADSGIRREPGKPLEDGMPIRRVQEPVAGDRERVGRPDLDLIKPLASQPSLGANRRHEGTFAACVHQHDIETSVLLLGCILRKKQRNALGRQRPTGQITKRTVPERAGVPDFQALSGGRSHQVEAATDLERRPGPTRRRPARAAPAPRRQCR